MSVQTVDVIYSFTIGAVGELASDLTELAYILALSELDCFEEVLGVVGFAGFGDVFLDG